MEDEARPVTLLVDHDLEGQAVLLWGTLAEEGWLDLLDLRFVTLPEVGLPVDSSDRDVWRFAQDQRMLLLTGNRRMREEASLEQTIRRENNENSLPVITVANVRRLDERAYRERCAARLIGIVLDLNAYLGSGRIYLP